MKYAALVAVGPDARELDRVADLIDSIRAYEPATPCHFIMVDDAAEPRGLERRFDLPKDWAASSVPSPRPKPGDALGGRKYKGKGICAVVLAGLSYAARHAVDTTFLLKLDTDALVIAPFVDRVRSAFDANPDVGGLGAYDRTPNGDARDISKNAALVERLHRGRSLLRRIANRFGDDSLSRISRHITAARANGYRYGEHCLGGGYAVSGEVLRRMLAAGYCDDPAMWLAADVPEDVMAGMYVRAVGLRLMSFVARGEFGVRHQGLPYPPPQLVERGYCVIHAVKNDPNLSEDEIRRFFKERRPS